MIDEQRLFTSEQEDQITGQQVLDHDAHTFEKNIS